jgi:glutaminyl-peptide cyclotransferase
VTRLFTFIILLLAALSPAHADTRWKLVKSYPHDSTAFTQGLIFLDGALYESTGQYGRSQIREVRLKDGKPLRTLPLDARYFSEGMTHWDGELISITWRARTGFRWKRDDFSQIGSFTYPGEGWGITQDGKRLIMSDGTDQLRFLDPETFEEFRRVNVTWNGRPVRLLNELEFVKGEILANVWMTDRIARIDPASGAVIDWIDLSALSRRLKRPTYDAVLNGIAYDAERDRLFVTGKYWPRLYEIRLKRRID